MTPSLDAAVGFLAGNGRVLERRRLDHLLGRGEATGVLAALNAYRNDDGGYGWALEPDLRTSDSQPAAALHAFEVMAEVAPTATPHAADLCSWLAAQTIAGTGLPFVLTIRDPAGCARWWREADTTTASLHISTAVAANAHRVGRHHAAVRQHPWLRTVTAWCLEQIDALTKPSSHELLFSMHLLDAIADAEPDAAALLARLADWLPADGIVPVTGGIDGEVFYPLDFSPEPERPLRHFIASEVINADLDRLANGQLEDGGWDVNFRASSPAGTLDWRGYATVSAIRVLSTNGRL
jgi:hypothetical protein